MIVEATTKNTLVQDYNSLHQGLPLRKKQAKEDRTRIIRDANDFHYQASLKDQCREDFIQWAKPISIILSREDAMEYSANLSKNVTKLCEEASSLKSLLTKLTEKTRFYFANTYKKYQSISENGKLKKSIVSNYRDFADQIKLRIDKIRPEAKQKKEIEGDQAFKYINRILNFGTLNVAHMTWSFFTMIPALFKRQYQRLPSVDEYQEIAKSAKKFIKILATGQDDVFKSLSKIFRRGHIIRDIYNIEPEDKRTGIQLGEPLQARDFLIVANELNFSPSFMSTAKRYTKESFVNGRIRLNEHRGGCSGDPLIGPIFNFCYKAAQNSMFKNPELIYRLNPNLEDIDWAYEQ